MNQVWPIRPIGKPDRHWLETLLDRHWGGTSMIVRGKERFLPALPAFIAGNREGIAIFEPGDPTELLLLHALRERVGIGTALLRAVTERVRCEGGKRLLVTTTNDNLSALQFYQRRGFSLSELRCCAVDVARHSKPSIPFIGFNAIPIRDEIDLILEL